MLPSIRPPFAFQRLAVPAALCSAVLLAACGGGDDDDRGLTQQTAQGYAADATTMTVLAASSMDSAAGALETALATTTSAADASRMRPADLTLPGGSAACAAGGTVEWGITGGNAETYFNGRLDAGETYFITYDSCATGEAGQVLDGGMTLVVTAASSSATDLTLTATALTTTTPQGTHVLDGSKRRQRTVVDLGGGARQVTARMTASGVSMATSINGRQASYTLRALDWTVVRNFDTAGALVLRTHQGTLDLVASTPRRPAATLQIATQGTLTLGDDGLAAAGGFTVITSDNRIVCNYGSGSVTLQLDLGNNGSIDLSWTLQRPFYNSEAG